MSRLCQDSGMADRLQAKSNNSDDKLAKEERPANSANSDQEHADHEKALAAEAAAALVEGGMTVGLGTGSTVAFLIPALAARRLSVLCVATSPATEALGRAAGLKVEAFDSPGSPARLDIAIDGADQVAPDGWLIKGGGAAHTREKVVAATADRFVVIVSTNKLVEALAPPVPLEILAFGSSSTLRRLGGARVRPDTPMSPDGGIIADWVDPLGDPSELAGYLDSIPGIIGHGLFPPSMLSDVMVAGSRYSRPPSGPAGCSWVLP